jgi:glycosidase
MQALEDRIAGYQQLGTSPDDNYRTWYEVFVYSFCDSNNDGVGDINGLRSKLDYLQSMGITGLWLMPIHPSPSYHKYDVQDYYDIDPQYGTMKDFEKLIAECNDRGIKVIIDLVVNHTAGQHEWFQITREYLKELEEGQEASAEDCEYFDYYHFSKEKLPGYSGLAGTDYYYECQFSNGMPDLNLANEAVREEIMKVMRFWIKKGVAGFRVDAAKEFYTGEVEKNVEVLEWMQDTATSLKEDIYMVAEVWDDLTTVTKYYKSGFTSIFNYPFGNNGGKIITTIRNMDNPNLVPTYAQALETVHASYAENHPGYIDAPFLSNHDVGRIFGFCSGDENKIKLAGAMNVLMSGGVFIYYGEEIGMPGSGNDPSKRAPMYWNAMRNDGTTNPPPECTLQDCAFGSLEEQANDPTSIYNYYREVIAIRNALPVISHGVPTAEAALNTGCISATRKTWEDQECIILMNLSTEAGEVDLSAYADWSMVASLSADGEPVTLEGTTLKMPTCGIAILLPN